MILIDYKDSRPLYEQIADKLEALILKGAMDQDSKIPSVRSLAMELSINPNTVQKAYERLEREGYIYTVKGKGNFIAAADQLLLKHRSSISERLLQLCREAMEIGMTQEELITIIKGRETL